jgi:MoaA/NifB/PqqE/SkfB family radical SAM enzyme
MARAPRTVIVFPPLRVSHDFIDYPYFADLGAVQAAAVLRAAGHDVALIDALARPGAALVPDGDDAHVRLGVEVAAVIEAATRAPADAYVVAYAPFHRPPARDATLAALLTALRAHAPEAPIVLADLYQSGQHVVDVPSAQILAAYPEVDAVLRYEAELDLDPLLRELLAGGRSATPFERRGREPALESLPLPAWDLVDLPAYWAFHASVMRALGRADWAFPIDGRALPMLTSRGCPFRCAHCSSNPGRPAGAPKTQRRWSPAYLARALDALVAHGARRVHLLDELANVNEAHLDALLDALAARGLAFEIPNGLRADYVLPKHLAAMRGKLTTLSVSAESGDPRVVNEVVDKQLDLAAIRDVATRARDAGIPLLVHFMIGLPGETKADVNRTLALAIELHEQTGAWPSVQFATPLPGTRLAAMVARGEHGARPLPVIDDWGPRFQQAPTIETEAFTLDELRRFKWTFDQRLAAGRGPRKVIMNATYRCNNHCTFCATGTRTQLDGDWEQQKAILREWRGRGVDLLDLDGGEPTLSPHLLGLIRYARAIGYQKVNVTTNGRLASYDVFADKLARSGATSILFSIHGPNAQIHAQNVGVAEAFDQTVAGVRNVVRVVAEAGLPIELGANVTITKSNHRHLPEMAQLVWDLGLRWWNLQFLTPFGRATSHVAPDVEVAARLAMRVIDEWRDRLKFQVINLPFCFMPGYEDLLVGDLLKLERHMIFVNNDEVNLFEYLRERRTKKPQCESCPHAVFCGGFYELDDVPEPKWLIAPEDLLRRPAARAP